MMNKSRFSRVEERIQQLVEGSFARLFAGRLHPREVAVHLARALENNAQAGPDGIFIAPNVFMVRLNPDDYSALVAVEPGLATSLTETIVDLANRAGMRLQETPTIEIIPDETLTLWAIHVEAYYEDHVKRGTQVMHPVEPLTTPPIAPRNPHLILQGANDIPLDRQVINLGRRRDNHIVIDDPRISRTHAQLRLRFGHYVIYDLGSSGGTLVNNHAVQEHILKSGDVISLAGVALIYIEEEISTGQRRVNAQLKTDTDTKRPPGLRMSDRDDDPTL
ncbi:MAG: DUF3662 and FHA domain-containing protein [Chloroflexota bacterium]